MYEKILQNTRISKIQNVVFRKNALNFRVPWEMNVEANACFCILLPSNEKQLEKLYILRRQYSLKQFFFILSVQLSPTLSMMTTDVSRHSIIDFKLISWLARLAWQKCVIVTSGGSPVLFRSREVI